MNQTPSLDYLRNQLISKIQEKESEFMITAIMKNAHPIIKGKLTKEKIIWRGIKIIKHCVFLDTYSWVEQRGKRISPKFHVKSNLTDFLRD